MNYEVVLTPQAESLLTQLWLSGRDHEALREALEQANQKLATDPLNAGESRSGDRRILFADPLALTFSVSQPERLVRILFVSRTRMRLGR